MALIDEETLREIHEAALSARLAGSREALMAGIDDALVDGIATARSRRDQVLVDLDALSKMNVAAGVAAPLGVWLANAARLADGLVEAAVFVRARAGLGGSMGERAAAAVVSIARLPAMSGELFGREADLAWLDGCWRDGVHVASVVAWGGVGKSALVNKWLAGLRDKGWEGVERVYGWSFYSQGTGRLSSSDEFVDAALRWFGDPDPMQGSAWDKGERLAALVRESRTILVLDGVEPLQWGPGVQAGRFKDAALEALLKELAGQNKGLCLVTSRIGLADLEGLRGDKVRAKALENLSPEAGVALLEARGAKGTAEELRAASEEYDGHGLALTLLGSYLTEVAEGDIRRRKEIGALEEAEQHGGHARRVMAAYEEWLGGAEVAILRMIGLFDRPADEGEVGALRAEPMIPGLTEALAGISGRDWNKAVAKLRKIGLLSAAQDKRLDAHPLVREHFGEQLRTGQPEAWREGHRRLYEYLKQSAKELPDTIEEMAPLYAAVVHGCMAGKNQEALDEVHWRRIRRRQDGFSWRKLGALGSEVTLLSAFFDPPWERLAPGLGEQAQASVLSYAGFALSTLGRLMEATDLQRLALERYVAHRNLEQAAIEAAHLGKLLHARGKLFEAESIVRESVDFADKSTSFHREPLSRAALATVLHARGRMDEAHTMFEEAERIQKEQKPEHEILAAIAGYHYCDLLLDLGRTRDVVTRAQRTLAMSLGRRWLRDIALDHLSLGRAHLLGVQRGPGGDLAVATTHLHQAVDGLRRSGDQGHLPLGLLARAALHTHTRDYPAAHHDLSEALSLATRCEFRLHAADAHLAYTHLALAQHDPATARHHLAEAKAIITQTGYHRRDSELTKLEAAISQSPPPSNSLPHRARQQADAHGEPFGLQATHERPLARARGAESVVALTAAPATPAPPAPLPLPSIAPKAMTTTPTPPVDFLIFAPLEEERNAILSKLPGHRKLDGDGADVHVYYAAEIATQRQDKAVYRVIVTSPKDMGPIHAAVTASTAATRWQPRHVLVVGIAGGLQKEVSLGDVAVARSIADYSLGKVEDGKPREERWEMYPSDPSLFHAANNFSSGFLDLVKTARPEGDDNPVRHSGVIASGGDVVAAPLVIAAYRKDMPKLIGVEMEGGAVAAALHSHALQPKLLMVRGVSDLADAEGNAAMKARWRAYARDVAAAYAIGLLREGPVPALQNPR